MSTLTKIWDLLTSEQRRKAVSLLGLMIVGMVLETLGVGLIIPALAVMTQSDLATRYPSIGRAVAVLGHPSREHLVMAGMAVLIGVYGFKALFLAFLAWRQMSFVNGVQAEVSLRLFAGYLCQPYTFHLQRNSAQLIRNATGETNLFAQTALMASLFLITELLVVVGILVLLLVVEPIGALVVMSALAGAAWGFQRLTHQRILRWGESRQYHDGLRIQHLQQGLGGAKEVKLRGREAAFLAQYQIHNLGTARAGQRLQTLQQLPRLLLEFLAVCGLAGLVFVMIGQSKPLDTMLPTIGLFAAAAFRLMPSANRVMGAIQNVRYALPVIGVLYDELSLLKSDAETVPGRPLPLRESLQLDNVTFSYPASHAAALRGVSLSVPIGSTVGFIGGSGAGKTTLVDVILGLLTPQHGAVRIDGVDVQTNLRGWQDQVGYVPQSVFLTDDTLRRNVAFGLSDNQIDDESVKRAIRAAQLESYVCSLPAGLDTMVGERGIRLSGGQLQRIGIARALYHDPPVLVLDEATSSLDIATERVVMEAVRALHGRKTVLIVAHRLSTVENCDNLFGLEGGQVVDEGAPADVISSATSFR